MLCCTCKKIRHSAPDALIGSKTSTKHWLQASDLTTSLGRMSLTKLPTWSPRFEQFKFAEFLRTEHKFDPSRKPCPFYYAGHCPAADNCPDKHGTTWFQRSSDKPSERYFLSEPILDETPPGPELANPNTSYRVVCKHWVRSLCQVGNNCRFVHEYNMFVLSLSFLLAPH